MSLLKWLNDNIEEFLMAILLCLIVIIMGLQVIMRYVFNSSLPWSEELVRYFFVWTSFLSLSYCIKNESSIKVVQLINIMPKRVQYYMKVITNIIILLFLILLTKISIEVVVNTYLKHTTSPAVGLPMYLVQFSTVLGFILSVIRIIQSSLVTIKHSKNIV